MKPLAALALLTLLAACAAPAAGPPHIDHVNSDEFSKNYEIIGMPQSETPDVHVVRIQATYKWALRSWVDKTTHNAHHAIYFYIHYSGAHRRNFFLANNENAEEMEIVPIEKAGHGCASKCDIIEALDVTIDEKMLRTHANSGFRIKISSRSGDEIIIPITPVMIQLQLEAVSKYEAIR